MMKTIYIILAYLMVWVNVVFTQNVFIKDYDPLGPANMKRVVPAKDGGFYIAGNNMVNDKTRLMKMDVNGDIVWEKYYGLPVGPTMMQEITQAKDGSFLIAGTTYGDITNYVNSTYLLKTDANGNQIFQKVYNVAPSLAQDSTVAEQAYSIALTKNDNILLSGSYVSNYAPNQLVLNEILYVRKLDSLGNELWRKDFGYIGRDNASRVIETYKGDNMICGYFGIPTVCENEGPQLSQAYYSLLINTDSAGNLEWTSTYGYENPTIDCSYGWFFDVIQTQDSNFIATGNWRGHVTVKFTENGSLIWKRWDIGGRIIKELASGELIILDHYNQKLVKTDAAGNTIWEKSYDIHANDMDIMEDDGFIMVGSWDNVNRVIKTDCEGNIVNPVCFSTGIDVGSGGVMMLSGNPVSDVLRLRVADGGVYRVEIGDVLGRVHYSGIHSGGEVSLGTEGLTPGVYWIGVYGEEGDLMYSQKVVKY